MPDKKNNKLMLDNEKEARGWIKYISYFIITFTVFVLNIVTGYRLLLLYAVPVLLSLRYYSRIFTAVTALYTELMTLASAFAYDYLSEITELVGLDTLIFGEPGQIELSSWLYSGVAGPCFDEKPISENEIWFYAISNTVIIALITLICVRLVENARSMILRESKLIERENKLVKESTVDSLTGLLNRRAYNCDRAALTAENMKDLVFVMFDVNGLKAANDSMGHSAGDELIKGAGQCIKDSFEPYGRVYRWGGDEFAALIYAKPDELEKIKADFEAGVTGWSGKEVKTLSISAGYVCASEMGENFTVSDMEALGDQRMYGIKKAHYVEKEKQNAINSFENQCF